MISPSEKRDNRDARSGFTLIEVVIAFALSALVLGAVMITLSRTTLLQAERLHQLWLTEFAYSLLQLHVVTGVPDGKTEGQDSGGWSWSATEMPANPNPAGILDTAMSYAVIEVIVWNTARPEELLRVETIVARRR